MTPVLYLSGPYPGNPNVLTATSIITATQYRDQVEEKGWVAVCPSLYRDPNPWRQGASMLARLDPIEGDAVLMLPNWIRDARSVRERQQASARGLTIYSALVGQPLPTPEEHRLCPHYRTIHYETFDRDTCEATVRRCPPGARCPITEKQRRRRIV